MNVPSMSAEQLLPELDDLLRSQPSANDLVNADVTAWLGRAQAVVRAADRGLGVEFDSAVRSVQAGAWARVRPALKAIPTILHQARYALVMQTSDAGTRVIGKGESFDYFDEVRKVVQRARGELFFVDPYLNEDFVSRYLPFVAVGTKVRLLGRENIKTLRPAAEAFSTQSNLEVEVRAGSGFHDRFVFLDGAECYQSGASFHQGGRTTPTTFAPIVDAAKALLVVYDGIWSAAK